MSIIEAMQQISQEQARVWVRRYFGREPGSAPYTGAYFHRIGSGVHDPNRFTVHDLYSLQCLAVDVPAKAGLFLLETHAATANNLLEKIPDDLRLEELSTNSFKELLGPKSPALELWNLLRAHWNKLANNTLENMGEPAPNGLWGMGPTRVSKLMARKRPRLIPIEDSVVNRVIGLNPTKSWLEWWTALTADRKYLEERASSVREASEQPELSTLRALDIVLWMKGKHDDNCGDGASCTRAHLPF